jgi:hypothetical protein
LAGWQEMLPEILKVFPKLRPRLTQVPADIDIRVDIDNRVTTGLDILDAKPISDLANRLAALKDLQ